MFDWITPVILLTTDTFSQNVAIVTGAIILAVIAP